MAQLEASNKVLLYLQKELQTSEQEINNETGDKSRFFQKKKKHQKNNNWNVMLSFTWITNLVNQMILLTDENCYFYTFSLDDQECCLHWELLSILML